MRASYDPGSGGTFLLGIRIWYLVPVSVLSLKRSLAEAFVLFFSVWSLKSMTGDVLV